MARYIQMTDGFDYAFTVTDPEQDRYFSTYVDYDRSKGSDGKKIGSYIGTIAYDKGSFTVDKLPLQSSSTVYRVLPGKPGNVVILEYFRKEKRLDLRLEKINY